MAIDADTEKKAKQYYDEIMALKEAEEFKSIIEKWQALSERITVSPVRAPIILPDMLWVAKSGVGKTNLLRLLSEYLSMKGNLISFFGDVKFFEFMLCYCSPRERFTEIERLMNEVSDAAGFRNEFRGIIYIDIDEWVGHCDEKHFVSFMEYLSSNSEDWMIVLGVTGEPANQVKEMEAFISMYLRIERVTLTLPKTSDLFGYIERILGEYGLSLADDGKELLFQTIEKLRKNRYFDGFKTIKMLCQDIVYSVFTGDVPDNGVLSANMLSGFSKDSEYVKRTVYNIETVKKIGLLNKSE